MTYLHTVEGMKVDYDSLFEDMKGVDNLSQFLRDHLSEYCDHDDNGSEVVCYKNQFGIEYENENIDNWIQRHEIYEYVINKNVEFHSDLKDFDPFEYTCTNINNWLEYDSEDIINQFLETLEDG